MRDERKLLFPPLPPVDLAAWATPQADRGDGLREALLVELAASIPRTCDWGGCDNNALLARHDAERGWLGVCQWHAADASSGDLAPITAVAFEDAWNRATLATASAPGLDVETLARAELLLHSWPREVAASEARELAVIYARLRESADQERTEG